MDLMYAIPAAVGLGALHSLEPGHGKGVITAYLISSGAKLKDAVLIGLISAAAHTLSIGLLALSASSTVKVLLPETLSYWFQLISGIIVIYIGLSIITQKLFDYFEAKPTLHQVHKSDLCGDHCCHRHHEQLEVVPSSRRNLFLTGFFIGIVPCPSALAILLAAVSTNRIPMGVGLVGAFSIGSAITMVSIAIVVVQAGHSIKKIERWQILNRLALVSSFLIIFLGGAVILQALNRIGFVSTF